jgi:hypothetical protein
MRGGAEKSHLSSHPKTRKNPRPIRPDLHYNSREARFPQDLSFETALLRVCFCQQDGV